MSNNNTIPQVIKFYIDGIFYINGTDDMDSSNIETLTIEEAEHEIIYCTNVLLKIPQNNNIHKLKIDFDILVSSDLDLDKCELYNLNVCTELTLLCKGHNLFMKDVITIEKLSIVCNTIFLPSFPIHWTGDSLYISGIYVQQDYNEEYEYNIHHSFTAEEIWVYGSISTENPPLCTFIHNDGLVSMESNNMSSISINHLAQLVNIIL